MTKLTSKIDNALDETRMLMLGAQVLIGFQYGAAFQPGFERLEPGQQDLKVLGLALLLRALGFLAAPGAYHQIVRGGYDTADVMQFINWVAACALLPFAVSIGIDVY